MAAIEKSVVSLRIFGDHLAPESITRIIGCKPTRSHRKGDVERTSSGREFTRKTGMWLLAARDREPENIDEQVAELLRSLTKDLGVWASLSREFEIDLFCGLFMKQSTEGLSLSPATLLALAERNVEVGLDIYAASGEHAEREQMGERP